MEPFLADLSNQIDRLLIGDDSVITVKDEENEVGALIHQSFIAGDADAACAPVSADDGFKVDLMHIAKQVLDATSES